MKNSSNTEFTVLRLLCLSTFTELYNYAYAKLNDDKKAKRLVVNLFISFHTGRDKSHKEMTEIQEYLRERIKFLCVNPNRYPLKYEIQRQTLSLLVSSCENLKEMVPFETDKIKGTKRIFHLLYVIGLEVELVARLSLMEVGEVICRYQAVLKFLEMALRGAYIPDSSIELQKRSMEGKELQKITCE